jgi:hypothetical protein
MHLGAVGRKHLDDRSAYSPISSGNHTGLILELGHWRHFPVRSLRISIPPYQTIAPLLKAAPG